MNFGGIGPMELILILVVALIVFGPGKLPELGAGLGRAIREFRRMSSELTRDLNIDLDEKEEEPTSSVAADGPAESQPALPAPATVEPSPALEAGQPLFTEPVATVPTSGEEVSPPKRKRRRSVVEQEGGSRRRSRRKVTVSAEEGLDDAPQAQQGGGVS
ncbi:MAG: twin-arginine translocase TatA/TatE family subunit [Chloroflexi bacterium]|nr:twin-arginine translocase TatA/TatE family subunit [Chloroflexota bacterium]